MVIGAGQAGLSTAHHLGPPRRRTGFVVLDANPQPGGAWQHRWRTLTMGDVHGVAVPARPGGPGPRRPDAGARGRARLLPPLRGDLPAAGGAPGAGRPGRRRPRRDAAGAHRRAAPGRPGPWSTPPAPGTGRSCRRTRVARRSWAGSCTPSTTTAPSPSAHSGWSWSAAARLPSRSSASWRRWRPRPG